MKTPISWFMRALAVIIFIQFVASQIYDPHLEGLALTIWRILDPLMVVGLVIVIANAYPDVKRTSSGGVNQIALYISSRVRLYSGWFIMALLLWNWAGNLIPNAQELSFMRVFIDAALPVLFFSTGILMARGE